MRLPDDAWPYNWEADEFTQIPEGFALGRAFTIGERPVKAFLGAWYSANDATGSPEWAIKASFSLVFPKQTIASLSPRSTQM